MSTSLEGAPLDPPEILDAKSWNFWHLVLLGQPPPPLPTRPLPL